MTSGASPQLYSQADSATSTPGTAVGANCSPERDFERSRTHQLRRADGPEEELHAASRLRLVPGVGNTRCAVASPWQRRALRQPGHPLAAASGAADLRRTRRLVRTTSLLLERSDGLPGHRWPAVRSTGCHHRSSGGPLSDCGLHSQPDAAVHKTWNLAFSTSSPSTRWKCAM